MQPATNRLRCLRRAAGQVRVTTTATTTRIEVSLDADPDAEMLILLNGIHELTAANFSL